MIEVKRIPDDTDCPCCGSADCKDLDCTCCPECGAPYGEEHDERCIWGDS